MTIAFAWDSAAGTHVGRVRQINEDSFLDLPGIGLWAVADGMGGHDAGDVASQTVIEELSRVPPPISREALIGNIEQRVRAANARLCRLAEDRGGGVVGSTVAVLACCAGSALCLWAGDSRVYRWRDGALRRLTEDHSQVQEMVRLGLVSADEVDSQPGGNIITRAVGASQHLNLDRQWFDLAPGDIFLLCSDGLTAHLKDAEIAAVLTEIGSSQGPENCAPAVARLVDQTLERGAKDNVTVVIVQVRHA